MTITRAIEPAQAHLSLTPTGLLIERVLIGDGDVMASARRAQEAGQSLQGWLQLVLRSGAIATQAASTGRDLADLEMAVRSASQALRDVIEQSSGRLNATVNAAVDPENGPLARATRTEIDRLATGVTKLITGTDAVVPSSIRASVSELTASALQEIVRALAAQGATVQQTVAHDRQLLTDSLQRLLGQQHTAVVSQIGDLREQLAGLQTNRRRTSAVRGSTWEATVVGQLSRIASAAGDGGATATGTTTGSDGSKVGDAVVQFRSLTPGAAVGTLGKLVVEAKDHSSPLSLDKIRQELRAGLSNREADVALLVCPSADMLPGSQSLLVISDRQMAVAWAPGETDETLQAAYLLLKVACARDGRGHDQALDLSELRRRASTAQRHLEEFDTLQRYAGAASKSVEQIKAHALKIREILSSELEAVAAALSRS